MTPTSCGSDSGSKECPVAMETSSWRLWVPGDFFKTEFREVRRTREGII
jgi:hypothetical protein